MKLIYANFKIIKYHKLFLSKFAYMHTSTYRKYFVLHISLCSHLLGDKNIFKQAI